MEKWLFIVSAGLFVVAFFTFLAARREKRFDLFLWLWNEYSSKDILDAMRALHELWNKFGGDNQQIIEEYKRKYALPHDPLHYQRRRVSLLYQRLAFLYYNGLIPRKIKRKWLGFSLSTIAILHPIETEALKQLYKDEPKFPETLDLKGISSPDFLGMFGLYNEITRKKKPPVEVDQLIRLLMLPFGGSTQYINFQSKK